MRKYILYLFIRYIPYPATTGSTRSNAKKRNKQERTKEKQEKEQKKETGSGTLRSYDPHGSFAGHILKRPRPNLGKKNKKNKIKK